MLGCCTASKTSHPVSNVSIGYSPTTGREASPSLSPDRIEENTPGTRCVAMPRTQHTRNWRGVARVSPMRSCTGAWTNELAGRTEDGELRAWIEGEQEVEKRKGSRYDSLHGAGALSARTAHPRRRWGYIQPCWRQGSVAPRGSAEEEGHETLDDEHDHRLPSKWD